MIEITEKNDYEKIIPVIKGVHFDFVIESLIIGGYPSNIWVDDVQNPETMLVSEASSNFYFAGYAKNTEFNKAVKKLILERIIPTALSYNQLYFKVYYSSNNWQTEISEIFEKYLPVTRGRRVSKFNGGKIPDWKDRIPDGYTIHRINRQLLERDDLKNVESITEEIHGMWISIDAFLENGFGFCTVKEDKEVICWCTAEYVSRGKCGVGIETIERESRNKGFATLTAAAFVDYCEKNNVIPYWENWLDNYPSIRVAEKVGFEKRADFSVSFGSYDEFIHYFIQGDHCYRLKQYKEAVNWYMKATKVRNAKGWEYYQIACACALAGDTATALRNLNEAVENGWTNVEHMQKDQDLISLHDTKDWEELLAKIRNKLG